MGNIHCECGRACENCVEDAYRVALAELVDALNKCDCCNRTATAFNIEGSDLCDAHRDVAADLVDGAGRDKPYAAPLRAALALLGR